MSLTWRQICLLAVLVTMVSPWSASAATTLQQEPIQSESVRVSGETVARPVVVATTDVKDAQLVYVDGHNITILFDLFNASGVQPGVVYGVELMAYDSEGYQVVDVEVLSEEPVTLGVGETLPVAKTYTAPAFLSGSYELWVVAKTQTGMPLSLAPAGKVSLSGAGDHVLLSDCVVRVSGAPYALSAGVDVAPGEAMTMQCVAKSSADTAVTVTPQFTTYERSVYGQKVEAPVIASQPFTLEPNTETRIELSLPVATDPQAYDVLLELVSESGVVVSHKVIAHYVVQGESATLQNVVFDNEEYAAGETATAMVTWSLAADMFEGSRGAGTVIGPLSMSVVMADATGEICSAPTVVSLQQASLISRLTVPVVRDCAGPQLVVGLTDEMGAHLALQTYEHTPTAVQEELVPPAAPLTEVARALLLAVTVLALFVFAVKLLSYVRTRRIPASTGLYEPTSTKKNTAPSQVTSLGLVVSLFIGGGVLLGVGVSAVSAATLTIASGYDTIVFTVNTNKSTYEVDEDIRVSGAAFVMGCGNAITAGGLEAKDGQGVTQTIGVFNMDPYTNPGGSAIFNKYILGYSTPGDKLMPIRAYVTNSGLTSSALDSLPLTVLCPAGTDWSGASCVSEYPEPSAVVTGSGCTIAVGDSSCVASISWDIQHATEPSVRNVTTDTVYSYAPNGVNELRTITHGVNVVAAYDNLTTLDTEPIIASCEEGSSWDGVMCKEDEEPTGMITATSCEIPAGGASCVTVVDWDTDAATTPNVFDYMEDVQLATAASGDDVAFGIMYGSHEFQVRDGATVLNSALATATCETGAVWNGTACVMVGSATLSLTANGDTGSTHIAEGDDVDLEWLVTGDIDECAASVDWTGLKTETGGTETMAGLVADSVYTLTCSGLSGVVSDTVTVYVNTPANLMPIGLSLSPSTNFDPVTGVYETLYVQYSIRNSGETDAGSFENRIKLDRGADNAYEEIVDDPTSGGLTAGNDSPIALVHLASDVPFGTHRVHLTADVLNEVDEGAHEGDNEDQFTLTVPAPDPHLELIANPSVIRSGQSATLSWNTQVTFPLTCRVRGPGVTYDFDPSSDGSTGSLTAHNLTAQSEFMLSCTETVEGTGATFTDSAVVRVVGTLEEV